jgi:hypothetical protein
VEPAAPQLAARLSEEPLAPVVEAPLRVEALLLPVEPQPLLVELPAVWQRAEAAERRLSVPQPSLRF